MRTPQDATTQLLISFHRQAHASNYRDLDTPHEEHLVLGHGKHLPSFVKMEHAPARCGQNGVPGSTQVALLLTNAFSL